MCVHGFHKNTTTLILCEIIIIQKCVITARTIQSDHFSFWTGLWCILTGCTQYISAVIQYSKAKYIYLLSFGELWARALRGWYRPSFWCLRDCRLDFRASKQTSAEINVCKHNLCARKKAWFAFQVERVLLFLLHIALINSLSGLKTYKICCNVFDLLYQLKH